MEENPPKAEKLPPPTRPQIIKEVLLSYAIGAVTAASSLAWALGAIRDTLVPLGLRHFLVVIPNWRWQTWLTIWAISLVLVTLEGCYRVVRKREARTNVLVDTVNDLVDKHKELQAGIDRLKTPPEIEAKVMKHAEEGWSKLKDFEKEAICLLLIFEHLTDLEAIRKLNQQGMAMSHAHVFPMIAENTGFLSHVDPPSHYTTGYVGRWAIKPSVKEAVKQLAEKETRKDNRTET